ncbi:MAG: glutamine--fructose-6-phosphate transaminase (isomerizing), partial [Spirochaetota bacterium]
MGYVGEKNAPQVIINGLKRLEYRGYDSAGIAVVDGGLSVVKKKGKIAVLESQIDYKDYAGCHTGIGHTRWATHGAPSDCNSHPHCSCNGEIAVVHNGIIENYSVLKKKLIEKGHVSKSETDSEVVAHLVEQFYKGSLLEAVTETLSMIEGTYGLAIVSSREPGRIIAARKGSPLVIGIGNGETIVAS